MRRTLYFVMALALMLGLSQCKKEQPVTPQNGHVRITLNVTNGNNNGAKAEVVPPHVNFVSGDQILVASGGHYVGTLTLTHNGTSFSGDITNPVDGEPLYFYFLGNNAVLNAPENDEIKGCTVNISDQTSYPALPVISMGVSINRLTGETVFYSSEISSYEAQLHNKCALVKFNVTTSSEAATCITGKKNKVTVSFAENTLTHSQEGNGVITLPAGNGEKWAILLPQEAMVEGSAYSADGNYTGSCGAVPTIYENGYLTLGIEVNVSTSVAPVHEYVDLGLPSGLLWATCNVGANAPEEYGDYFAWGETQTKSSYNWNTYQYCNGSQNTLTKYCNKSEYGYNGFTDDLTTLLPEDDAATANWGSDWRMPTEEEFIELYNNTTGTWTQQGDVNGWLFTAKNGSGNSLFLPAAGLRYDGSLDGAGSCGFYWGSLYTFSPYNAWNIGFNSGNCTVSYGNRYFGQSVRAVRSAPQN